MAVRVQGRWGKRLGQRDGSIRLREGQEKPESGRRSAHQHIVRVNQSASTGQRHHTLRGFLLVYYTFTLSSRPFPLGTP
jgi:hypothetical protein